MGAIAVAVPDFLTRCQCRSFTLFFAQSTTRVDLPISTLTLRKIDTSAGGRKEGKEKFFCAAVEADMFREPMVANLPPTENGLRDLGWRLFLVAYCRQRPE